MTSRPNPQRPSAPATSCPATAGLPAGRQPSHLIALIAAAAIAIGWGLPDPARLASVTAAETAPAGATTAPATTGGMVATGHPLATEAAIDVLRQGGNAVDAAVAAALTLGVVDGYNSGIGGGCFILIRRADGRLLAIDGRETAPAAAHPDMYLVDGEADTSLSQSGPLASGTPGALAALAKALDQAGSLPLADLLQTGIRHAEEGFEVDAAFVARIAAAALTLRQFEGSRALLTDADGEGLRPGSLLVQTDLAATYRGIAEHGPDHFYRGPVAAAIGEWMAANGGILTADDFAGYQAHLREPVRSTYRGHEIIGFPPPSSGGVHVAQILNILENFDLAPLRDQPDAWVHLVAETMKLAFADRAHWLGDPDFFPVPKGLTDVKYAAGLAARIDPERASEVAAHATPPDWEDNVFERHTTHLSVADDAGNWVAITATINTSFGSKVIVPGTGVVLNNEMDDFSIQPGVPNHFGLVGSEANKVEPGKRPLSSMSPTLVLDPDGRPLLAVGAAGGPTIISQAVLAVIGVVDFDLTIDLALAQPRFHHQWLPPTLRLERAWDESVREALEARGHELQPVASIGRSQAVLLDADGRWHGAADPRGGGLASGPDGPDGPAPE